MPKIYFPPLNFAGNTAKTDPIRLAMELEQARRRLSGFLLDNVYAAGFIANQLSMRLQKSEDLSDDANEENPLLQTHNPRIGASNIAAPDLHNQHLLPLFLIDAAVLLDRQPLNKAFNIGHKRKLERYRRDLQDARQRMITANIGLAGFAAHKYTASNLGFDDLMQEGILGLIKAVDRFDPERGICFSTYAMYWIKQAISRLIVKQEKIVRLPLPLAEKAASVFEAMRSCYLQYERWPTRAELMKVSDLPEQDIKTISSYYQATHSLDEAIHHGEDSQDLMEKMVQHQFSQPLDELIDEALAEFLDKAVATLPEKQATILTMRFGLQNQSEMTLQAVADQLHVTRERVRQIQNDALKKLKQQFGYDLLPFLDANEGTQ
jgi:RNA polymerase primary sigma factor